MSEEVVISLPRPPAPILGENQLKGMHWAKRKKALDPWRDEFTWVAKAHRAAIQAMAKPVTIQMTYRFPVNRIRDPHNFSGGCQKAAIDSLVLAGCVPDDNPLYVRTVEPVILIDRESQAVTLTIRPAETSRARDTPTETETP